jgi:hypothetical protein
MRMGDRPESGTTNIYFDMRIEMVIRGETVKQIKNPKIGKFKKI